MPSLIIAQGGGPTAVINQTLCRRRRCEPQAPSRRARFSAPVTACAACRDGDYVDLSAIARGRSAR